VDVTVLNINVYRIKKSKDFKIGLKCVCGFKMYIIITWITLEMYMCF